jgi:hypothetical protein
MAALQTVGVGAQPIRSPSKSVPATCCDEKDTQAW